LTSKNSSLIVPTAKLMKPGNAGGEKGLTGRCIEEGNNAGHRAYKSIVNGTKSTISRQAVNLSEEPDAGNLQVRFCEGLGSTDTEIMWHRRETRR
jgi:hypothetical protein